MSPQIVVDAPFGVEAFDLNIIICHKSLCWNEGRGCRPDC